MKNTLFIPIFLAAFFSQCKTDSTAHKNLTKLSRSEIINYHKKDLLSCENIFYDNRKASSDELSLLQSDEYNLAYYVDEKGDLKQCKIRPSDFYDHITKILVDNIHYSPFKGIPLIDINCEELDSDLIELSRLEVDEIVEKYNLDPSQIQDLTYFDYYRILIASVDESCGIENLSRLGKTCPGTFWSMVHHNDNEVIAYYYSYFDSLVTAGVLHPETLALSTDRLLVGNGYMQAYGSQVINGQLPKIKNLDSVDLRRAKIGLEPLNDYLDVYGLEYKL